ncbi:hypothetical protein TELCIR_14114 [Teladorsagia circumcincta]|uniref:SCP domain-containing protein n=1 Tax=Teladorsagia circumcincta TaxID=45464 RepID=A0A2G9U250_TELCI|nr:hypothetical protein TELCIR_14114 [Teladorsagia circumcincta]
MSRNGQGENFAMISSYDAQQSNLIAAFKAIKTFWREIKTSRGINRRMQFTEHFRNRQDAPLRFTQMAWATTRQFGCGVKSCNGNYVVVCRYSPRGNIVGQNIYNVGSTCSQCAGGCTNEGPHKGLCIV